MYTLYNLCTVSCIKNVYVNYYICKYTQFVGYNTSLLKQKV